MRREKINLMNYFILLQLAKDFYQKNNLTDNSHKQLFYKKNQQIIENDQVNRDFCSFFVIDNSWLVYVSDCCIISCWRYERNNLELVQYFTKFSNWMMMGFLIPFAYYDIKNFYTNNIKDRYPNFVNLLFQGLHPVIFLVMATYQSFILIDPNLLLVEEFHPDEWQIMLLFYLHCGNWILIQFEFFLSEHEKVPKIKLLSFFVTYLIIYLMIYGTYFYFEGKHVYGFQQTLSIYMIIILHIFQFFMLLLISNFYNTVTHSKVFKKFVLEYRLREGEDAKNNKSK